MNSKLLFLFFLCFQFQIFAQEDAWVYFTDKEDVEASIANPISILTQKAIDRKQAHAVPIDARDVPVNEAYISLLKARTGITVYSKSKWFNAVHVRGTKANVNSLVGLSYVDKVVFANRRLNGIIGEPKSDDFDTNVRLVNYNYGSANNQIKMIKGEVLHQKDYTGEGMTIAVIDAGFPNVHTMTGFKRLRDNNGILGTYNFPKRRTNVYTNTSSNHGTHVLSTMAGYVEDRFVGTAPDAAYYLFVTEITEAESPLEESYWVEATERADSLGVDVINSSLGYKVFDNTNYSYSNSDMDGLTAYISKGANIAFEKGILVVISAGNEGAKGITAPGDAAGSLTIGAVNSRGAYASFSSQGSRFQPTHKPDITAQGQASAVIKENNSIGTADGTSFSSPIMAGALACLWQALPTLNNAQIMQIVRESASIFTRPNYFLGYGIPNLSNALDAGIILGVDDVSGFQNQIQFYPNPVINDLHISLPSSEKQVQLKLYNVLGKEVLESNVQNSSIIDVSFLAKGVYLMKVDTQNGTQTKKLIKR